MADRVVTLNVGGTQFQARASLFSSHPSSLLGTLFSSELGDRSQDDFFFDANPRAFESILDMYRRGVLKCPPEMDSAVFAAELDFWQIPSSDSASNLLAVDPKTLRQAVASNTRRFQHELLADKAKKDSAISEETGPAKCTRSATSVPGKEESEPEEDSEVLRLKNLAASLLADTKKQMQVLSTNERILASVSKALHGVDKSVAKVPRERHELLMRAVDEVGVVDGQSIDIILTNAKHVISLSREKLSGDDAELYDWWAKTVGAKNLQLFHVKVFARPDREEVIDYYTFVQHVISDRELEGAMFSDAEEESEEEDDGGAEGGGDGARPDNFDCFQLGRFPHSFETVSRYGSSRHWQRELKDYRNGGYYTLARFDVPVLRVSWSEGGPSLEDRLRAVLRGLPDPSPLV